MKKLIFTIYLMVLFILSANAANRLPDTVNHQRIRQGIETGDISRREAARLLHQEKRIHRMRRNIQADHVITGREERRLQHANRIHRRSIRHHRIDSNNQAGI